MEGCSAKLTRRKDDLRLFLLGIALPSSRNSNVEVSSLVLNSNVGLAGADGLSIFVTLFYVLIWRRKTSVWPPNINTRGQFGEERSKCDAGREAEIAGKDKRRGKELRL